jgi:hypothetical protein
MREVARRRAGALDDLRVLLQHPIEFAYERAHLRRVRARHQLRLSVSHGRQLALQALERCESDHHLHHRRRDEPESEQAQCKPQGPAELRHRFQHRAFVRGNDQPQRPLGAFRRIDAAFEHGEPALRRAVHTMLVKLTVRHRVIRYFEHSVPKRARTQQALHRRLAATRDCVDLPIQAGIGSAKARIAERRSELQLAAFVYDHVGGELVQMGMQLREELAFDMFANECSEPPAGDCDRCDDPDQRAGQQAYAKRLAQARESYHSPQTSR